MWTQNQILLTAKSRGFHLITTEIIDALPILNTIECGLLHLFVKQTSASLIINENANPAANQELVMPFDENEPEKSPYGQYDYDKAGSRYFCERFLGVLPKNQQKSRDRYAFGCPSRPRSSRSNPTRG